MDYTRNVTIETIPCIVWVLSILVSVFTCKFNLELKSKLEYSLIHFHVCQQDDGLIFFALHK